MGITTFSIKERKGIIADIKDIRYHMNILNGETGELRDAIKDLKISVERQQEKAEERTEKMIQVSTDVDWLKKAYWVIFATSAGAFVTGTITLLSRLR